MMKKNRLEKVRKHVFYKHTNIVTKKWGKKTRENFFPKTHVYREIKTMENNRLDKVRKHVFYENTNIVTKIWGGKNARKFFSRNTRISRVLNDGKKSSGKSAKTRFFINTRIS